MANKRATTIRGVYGKTEDRYLDLVRRFPLRPLRSDSDLDAAIAVIDALIDQPRLTAPEGVALPPLASSLRAEVPSTPL